MRRPLLAAALLFAGCATAPPRPHEGFAPLYWPQSAAQIEYPRVVVQPDGRREVEPTLPPPALSQLYAAAEQAFSARDCAKAEERYNALLAQAPTFYPALLGLGDCALRQGKARDSIELYHQAQQLNPDDFLAWFSEADARLKTGNVGEARELLIMALVLNPRRPSVLQTLHAVAEHAGVTVDDAPIAPTAWFQDEKNLYLNRPYPWWVSYAVCKHLGCTEPDLDRCDIKGRQPLPPAPWDAKAETACVRVAAAAYRNKRDPGYSEAALERFLAADAAGLGEAYVLYEIGSRLDPHIVLRLSPEKRKDVNRYVRSFVIVDRR